MKEFGNYQPEKGAMTLSGLFPNFPSIACNSWEIICTVQRPYLESKYFSAFVVALLIHKMWSFLLFHLHPQLGWVPAQAFIHGTTDFPAIYRTGKNNSWDKLLPNISPPILKVRSLNHHLPHSTKLCKFILTIYIIAQFGLWFPLPCCKT